jgi:Fe-S-cluster containining protein
MDRELNSLAIRGIHSTCARGCSHCCWQEIPVSKAEAESIADWITDSKSAAWIEALSTRLTAWLDWYRTDYPALIRAGVDRSTAFYQHGPACPALVDDECTIYEMRPMVCRNHCVSSPPDACRRDADPKYSNEATAPLTSLVRVTRPAANRIKNVIEGQGLNYWQTTHLLPEWLAHLLKSELQPWRTAAPLYPGA